MKSAISKLGILWVCLSLLPLLSFGANLWQKNTIRSAPEAGYKCSVFVDKSGAVHMAWLENSDSDRIMYYANRSMPGLTIPRREQVGPVFTGTSVPEHLDISVRKDGTVEIASVRENGSINIYRKSFEESDWTFVSVASDAVSSTSGGGVSISSNRLVYTATAGDLKTSVRTEETWSLPSNLTSGSSSGLAPDLASSSTSNGPFAVVYYDNNTAEVKTRTLTSIRGGLIRRWSDATAVDSAPFITRPSIDIIRDTVGVTYRKGTADDNSIRYASRSLTDTDASWTALTVTSADEVDSELSQTFSYDPVVCHDAAANPWVVYKQTNIFNTIAVIGKRRLPDMSWETSLSDPQSSTAFHVTGQLSIDANGAGDPAIVYESDQGTNSKFILTRPLTVPWTFERITDEASSNNQFATALTSSPVTGALHFVSDNFNTGFRVVGGFIQPVITQRPAQLLTIHRGVRTTVEIPNSTPARTSHVVSVSPNGTIHVIGRESEDLLSHDRFTSDGTHIGNTTVTWDGSAEGVSGEQGLAAGFDAEGTLYLAFDRPNSNGFRIVSLPSGADTWENVTQTSVGGIALDLAVRGDGKLAVSHYDASARKVLVHTNIDVRSGIGLGFFETVEALALANFEPDPTSTSLLLIDSKLRLATTLSGPMLYLKPATVGPLDFSATSISTGFRHSRVRLLPPRDGLVSAILQTPGVASTKITHLTLPDESPSSDPILHRLADGLPENAGPIHVARDEHGFPNISTSFSNGLLLAFAGQHAHLVRPADALDLDQDGVPLLLENAFCLDPETKDSHLLHSPSSRIFGGTGSRTVSIDFPHRYPLGDDYSFSNELQLGEFHYRVSYTTDLANFETDIPRTSPITPGLTTAPDPEVGIKFQTLSLRFPQLYLNEEPKTFGRLEVFRLKKDIFLRL